MPVRDGSEGRDTERVEREQRSELEKKNGINRNTVYPKEKLLLSLAQASAGSYF